MKCEIERNIKYNFEYLERIKSSNFYIFQKQIVQQNFPKIEQYNEEILASYLNNFDQHLSILMNVNQLLSVEFAQCHLQTELSLELSPSTLTEF